MTPRKFTAMLATGVAAFTVLGTQAAPQDDRFPISIAATEERQAERFDKLDLDNDAVVSLAEFEQGKAPRHKRSGDKRKRLREHRGEQQSSSGRHARGAKAHRKAKSKAARAATANELFALLDTNADGVLSKAEHAARTREHMQTARKRVAFAKLDQNADGLLDRDELGRRTARLKEADADGDGQVTRREMRSLWRNQRQG